MHDVDELADEIRTIRQQHGDENTDHHWVIAKYLLEAGWRKQEPADA
jgi:hypothetical protein